MSSAHLLLEQRCIVEEGKQSETPASAALLLCLNMPRATICPAPQRGFSVVPEQVVN